MKGEDKFRANAKMLIECTKAAKILRSHRAAQDVELAVEKFVRNTVAKVDALEAEIARLRGEADQDGVPLV